ncbi:family 1 glycosylhydrolase [Sphingomonas yantingensis]|uniref:Beta-glucosidase n=1 Tax=Sphingomonas yantingensis TaxID=1241761 RepID=A0A7W9EH91_9SPHN|nr:family 1 glycosylhydrolase [Sphingomonas yantingensis]MBB5697932.1 beta-glucosidase [Sphingomonas yantingensis]
MTIDRRTMLAGGLGAAALAAAPVRAAPAARFPRGFLWGAATAGHQVEGNNVNSDVWLLEHVEPTIFREKSGDACNSFALWETDLDLVKGLGLNSYRFSLEWARIEPEAGQFSIAMLDHYKAMIDGCRARGLNPLVTFSHYTTPRWFAARGGWLNEEAPALFARFCDRAMRHLGAGISHVMTFNEPNIVPVLDVVLPPQVQPAIGAMLDSAARSLGVKELALGNLTKQADIPRLTTALLAAHRLGRQAIKAVRGNLPVGLTIAIFDDQAVGAPDMRDAMRKRLYGPWLEAARGDDFIGIQNYERVRWGPSGRLPPPKGAVLTQGGGEVYGPSVANAARYAYEQARVPVIVTEHGVSATDDRIRVDLIRGALKELQRAIAEGVPVQGYVHWSLIDNYEWVSGYKFKHGLFAFDPATFKRTAKPSAGVLGAIARANAA